MKINDYLWRVNYWRSRYKSTATRQIEKRKILKVNPKSVKISWYNTLIPKSRIDTDEWFTSKLKALENKKDLHDDYYLNVPDKNTLKEIKALDRMIYNEELKEEKK